MLYIAIFFCTVYTRPAFLFEEDGSIREFGVGYSRKTVLPIWFICIIAAILSYYSVLHFVSWNKL